MNVSPTGYVVLGMLNMGPRSGYEIKRFADNSTRFFWAASYGQIYPELRRLEDAGLVAGEEAGTGERRRRVYRIEPEGRRVLLAWLREPPSVWELGDGGLRAVCFAAGRDRDEALAIVARMRQASRAASARLAAIREGAQAGEAGKPAGSHFPALVLQYGLDFHAWQMAWCDEAEERIRSGGSFAETLTPLVHPLGTET